MIRFPAWAVRVFLISLIATASTTVFSSGLGAASPLGTFVFTTTDSHEISWAVPRHFGGAAREVGIIDAEGKTVPSDRGSGSWQQSDVYRFPRYGWYELNAKLTSEGKVLTGTVSVAVVPDNSRAEISTTSPFAMGCYFAMRYTPEELKAAARLASIAGVSFSREELRWDISEPKKGEYSWSKFDAGVRACLDSKIGVMGLLDYWGAYHHEKKGFTDNALADFASYVSRTVSRYKPVGELFGGGRIGISDWEIWNEPATFWFYTPEQFGRLTRAAYDAAHKSDPQCRVLFANAGDGFDDKALQAMRGRAFNAVAPHFYCPPRSPKEADLFGMLKKQIAFYEKRGIQVPFWITEMGWHSDNSQPKQRVQADYLVQSYVLALAAGYEKVFWYNFVCDSADKNAPEYGLLHRTDLSPKIAYPAFAGMVHRLEGAKFLKSLDLGRNVSCHLFDRGAAGQVAVIWADEGGGRLRLAADSEVEVFDMFSNPVEMQSKAIPVLRSPHYVSSCGNLDELLKSAVIEGIPQIDLELRPTVGAFQPGSTLEIVASNYTKAPCELNVTPKAGNIEFSPVAPVKVAAESTASLSGVIRGIKRVPENLYPLTLDVSVSGGSSLDKKFNLTEKLIRRGTAGVDGKLDEWTTAMPLRLDSPEQAVGINPWMDWNLSSVYYFMYDDANLYFAARVRDNVHAQPHEGELIWKGDSWQIGIDTHPEVKEPTAAGKYCYGLAVTKSGAKAVSWQGSKGAGEIKVATTRQPAQSDAKSPGGPPVVDELIYECAIPREMLSPATLKPGFTIGIAVLLNDNDGGGRAGWMESSPAIGTGFNPEMFHLFNLE